MAEIQFDPACVDCRHDAAKDPAGTTWQCAGHVRAERDWLRARLANVMAETDHDIAALTTERNAALTLAEQRGAAYDMTWREVESLRERKDRLEAERDALRAQLDEDNAVCLCGCPTSEHEDNGEDGEQCEHEDHVCLRTCPVIRDMYVTLRARLDAPPSDAAREACISRHRSTLLRGLAYIALESWWPDDASVTDGVRDHVGKMRDAVDALSSPALAPAPTAPAMRRCEQP